MHAFLLGKCKEKKNSGNLRNAFKKAEIIYVSMYVCILLIKKAEKVSDVPRI